MTLASSRAQRGNLRLRNLRSFAVFAAQDDGGAFSVPAASVNARTTGERQNGGQEKQTPFHGGNRTIPRMRFATAFLLAVAATAVFAQETFTVGSAAAQRGTTAYGAIDVPAGSDAATSIPVIVVNGARSGPAAAFVAGSHGTEYTSVVALTRLASVIDPQKLAGTAIIVPLVNVQSFEQMTVHLNPVDRKSMNGNYPGDPAGTQTQRVLAAMADQVVKRAGTIVDLHGGDLDEDLVPYSYWMRSGDAKADEASLALARAFGLERIIIEDLDLTKPPATRTLSGYTASLGKTAVVAEAGAAGVVDPKDVETLVSGCLSILGALHMYDWPVHPVEHPIWLGSGARVRADGPAIFTPAVRGGTYVSSGMILGRLTDFTGRPAGDVRAPMAGLVTFIRPVPSTWKDATLANVAPVYSEPPPYRKP